MPHVRFCRQRPCAPSAVPASTRSWAPGIATGVPYAPSFARRVASSGLIRGRQMQTSTAITHPRYRVDYAGQHVPSRRKILRGLIGAEERRQLFAADLPSGERVLDIGCGAGEFVFLLRARGVEATGIEPGEEFSDFSRRVMQVPIQTATVESATVAPASQRLSRCSICWSTPPIPGAPCPRFEGGWPRKAGWLWKCRALTPPFRRPRIRFTTPICTTSRPPRLARSGKRPDCRW